MRDVAYIALGSNLGQREVFLAEARRAISALATTRVLGHTDAEETAPIGPVAQGPFLNQMIAIETELSPHDLLAALKRIETDAGRVRTRAGDREHLTSTSCCSRSRACASPASRYHIQS